MNKAIFLFTFFIVSFQTNAQVVGGAHIYEFATLSSSARITALGDNLITVMDDDISLAWANPSTLNPSSAKKISFNHNFHFAGLDQGFVNYGWRLDSLNLNFHSGIKYIQYGSFDQTDEIGNITGTFKANEMAFVTGASRQLNERYSVGANLKFVYSRFESYTSVGGMIDLAGNYYNPEQKFLVTLVMQNMGSQFTSYTGTREQTPFDIQLGVSKQLKHLPFRFSVIGHHLHRWNILYEDPNEESTSILFGEEPTQSPFAVFSENFFRHLIFNGEFLLGKKENFRIRGGFNYFRRKELSVDAYRSFGGFSGGIGMKVKKFRFDYGFGIWHLAGSTHHLSLSTDLAAWGNK